MNWQDADFATAKHLIAEYKQIRETVQHGSLYRLISPRNGSEFSVTESVSLDRSQAAVFALLHSSQFGYSYPRIYLRGLDPKAQYRLHWITEKPGGNLPETASGEYWMNGGIDLELKGDFQATALRLDRVQSEGVPPPPFLLTFVTVSFHVTYSGKFVTVSFH